MRMAREDTARMRIAYDAAPLLNPLTGVGRYAAALLEHLPAADPNLEIVLYAIGRQGGGPPGLAIRRLRVPARVVVVGWELAGHPAGERLFGPAAAVHGTNFWLPPLGRAKGVVTIHDLTYLHYPEFCTRQIRRYRWILPRVLRRAALVITPSETIAAEVAEDLSFPRDRIAVTPEGVGAPPDDADPAVARRFGVEGDYVLFVGTREPRKNLSRLMAAMALLRDLGVTLVVAGPPGWGPEPAAGGGRVVVTGYVSDADLAGLMAGARVFAFPSLYEGFGLPPLEAMAAGVPVVAARAGSLPEVLGDAPFWCDPLDVESMASALREAIVDDGARARAMARGGERARAYRWSETARLTAAAYRRVITS